MSVSAPLPMNVPNAVIPSQVARIMGVSPQAVADRIAREKLETFEYFEQLMVPMRSVRAWQREVAKREAAR